MIPEYIIVHHTAHENDVPISTIRDWHVKGNGWRDVGYHYYIRKTGEIEVGRMEHDSGAHCQNDRMNHRSIGVCLSGDFTKQELTKKQIDSIKKLIISLKRRYNIKKVLGHKDVKGAKTLCPGFDVEILT